MTKDEIKATRLIYSYFIGMADMIASDLEHPLKEGKTKEEIKDIQKEAKIFSNLLREDLKTEELKLS